MLNGRRALVVGVIVREVDSGLVEALIRNPCQFANRSVPVSIDRADFPRFSRLRNIFRPPLGIKPCSLAVRADYCVLNSLVRALATEDALTVWAVVDVLPEHKVDSGRLLSGVAGRARFQFSHISATETKYLH